jgi:hypothetical protein
MFTKVLMIVGTACLTLAVVLGVSGAQVNTLVEVAIAVAGLFANIFGIRRVTS